MQHSTGRTYFVACVADYGALMACDKSKVDRTYGPEEIEHFLISLDVEREELDVREFGTDYDAAQTAYAAAERADCEGKLDIVLISADSLATIEQTHSSYFSDVRSGLEELLADAPSAKGSSAPASRRGSR